MLTQKTPVTDIRIYPFLSGVVLDHPPLAVDGSGTHINGHALGYNFDQLILEEAKISGPLHPGGSYCWTGRDSNGAAISSHWLILNSISEPLTFSCQRRSDFNGPVMPFVLADSDYLIRYEELTDIICTYPAPVADAGISQVKFGMKGWLVSPCLGRPQGVGVLIEAPTLPESIAVGTGGLSLSARSVRAQQIIGIQSLECVEISGHALFMKGNLN